MTDSEQNLTRVLQPGFSSRQRLVLVTEDHEDTRQLLRTIRNLWLPVIEAVDGEEAVQLAENSSPDLILMDSTLPRLDGLKRPFKLERRITDVAHRLFSSAAVPNQTFVMLLSTLGVMSSWSNQSIELLSRVLEKHLGVRSEDFGV